ncbi:hypothetical protein [Caulobacter endophyticus]|uniref:Uncharacterized protein n=1 Tax=Caulobacter endophyticus TaxID=2172652 RepID=A0A2T9K4T3_9CAUL|nr:hypothetical protein [Caulobacter endophyticus]PVM90990.1 hypothetical protein DDF67_08545 [Caulobacter endophyticus]
MGIIRRLALPLLWTLAAIAVWLSSPNAFAQDGMAGHYVLSLSGMLLAFAAAYTALAIGRANFHAWLGYGHLSLTAGGALLIVTPNVVVSLPMDPDARLALWNTVSSIGYLMTLAGLIAFVIVLIDTWRRRSGPLTPAR